MKNTYNLGIDVGNSQTKTKDTVFYSRVESGYDNISEQERIKVKYGGDLYSVGVGTEITNKQKYFSPFYKVLLLTAIAGAVPNATYIECNLVAGLPVQYFKDIEFRDKVKRELLKLKEQSVIIESSLKLISINNVEIFVEGGIVSLYERFEQEKIIVIDIGGYSIDAIEFLYSKLGKSKTYMNGILKLKANILQTFNQDNNTSVQDIDELFNCILDKKDYFINKRSVNLDKYENMIILYIQKLINDLNLDFVLEDKRLVFIGGGSIALNKYIKEFSGDYAIEIIEDININAKVYQDLAENIFEEA